MFPSDSPQSTWRRSHHVDQIFSLSLAYLSSSKLSRTSSVLNKTQKPLLLHRYILSIALRHPLLIFLFPQFCLTSAAPSSPTSSSSVTSMSTIPLLPHLHFSINSRPFLIPTPSVKLSLIPPTSPTPVLHLSSTLLSFHLPFLLNISSSLLSPPLIITLSFSLYPPQSPHHLFPLYFLPTVHYEIIFPQLSCIQKHPSFIPSLTHPLNSGLLSNLFENHLPPSPLSLPC